MKKRVIAALLLCLAPLFAGCAAQSAPEAAPETTAPAQSTIALSVWVGDHQDQPWMNGVIERFKAAYPENDFRVDVGVISEGEAKSTVLNDVEAAADIYTFADDQFNELYNAGALQAVENAEAIVAANGGAEAPAVRAAGVDGRLYAYPATASNGYFMFYNKEYFDESDVGELDRMLEIAAASGKKVGFPMRNGWYLYSFFRGAGLTMTLSEDGVTNVCDWNATDTEISGVEVLRALLEIAAHPGFADADSDPFVAGVKDGSIIAGVSGSWNANAAAEAWGESYAAAKLPTYAVAGGQRQMSSFAGFKLAGVNPYGKNVGWAMRLAELMTDEQSQMSRFELRSEGPSNTAAASSEAVRANPGVAALAAQSPYADIQRVGGQYWSPAATLGAIIVGGNAENADLQTLLDTAVAGITAPVEP